MTRQALAQALVLASGIGLASPALAATYQYINIAAASFAGHATSDHNDGIAPDACTSIVPLKPGEEDHGGLQGASGSFIANADLPQGGRLAAFNLFASDADNEANTTVYLMRRRLAHGISASHAPDGVIATASTSGAEADAMRAFPGKIINAAVIDNSQFQYFVELVNCSVGVEPFTVQIVTVQQ